MSASQLRTLRIARLPEGPGWIVELDGQDVAKALTGLSLRLDGGPVVTAVLDVVAEEIPNDLGEVRAWLPDATKDLLVRLGWTPPAEEATP
ncbi:hypothetical protein [Streptomyces sp. NBC_01373]|uniref:hypothetical protein n=1 Tax=Streptomyces sp. NBC_01373 TaxID=2903843 RepID=UPI0022517359|nr:hypothetical protein [Streptomyces sp. NBC_01373]MCX4703874.1 hypothetical protein [Streptomyces sp. NBC_01373]